MLSILTLVVKRLNNEHSLNSPSLFADLRDLARLTWFDLAGDRLILDPDLGPIIDIHTHLSLTYLVTSRVDQELETDRVLTYLPDRDRELDLEVYTNKNMHIEDQRRMRADLILGSFRKTGPRFTHTAANLLRCMSDLCIRHAVILPVDFPWISRNSELYLEVSERHSELIPFGSAHPWGQSADLRLKKLAEQGIRGLKVHPATQLIFPGSRRAMRLYRASSELSIPVLWHCGVVGIEPWPISRFAEVRNYEKPIAALEDVTFILGHSGGLQYQQAIDLAQRYPNVILDLSCQGLDGIRAILDAVDHDRIVNGSDWPFYHQAIGIAKVLLATGSDKALRRKILYENAVRVLGLDECG